MKYYHSEAFTSWRIEAILNTHPVLQHGVFDESVRPSPNASSKHSDTQPYTPKLLFGVSKFSVLKSLILSEDRQGPPESEHPNHWGTHLLNLFVKVSMASMVAMNTVVCTRHSWFTHLFVHGRCERSLPNSSPGSETVSSSIRFTQPCGSWCFSVQLADLPSLQNTTQI